MNMYGRIKICIIVSFLTNVFFSVSYSAEKLIVDLTNNIRPVTHCASGSLYGMTETLPADVNELVAPLRPHLFCQPPSGKSGNQHDFGDAFIVADRLKGTTAQVQLLMADLLPYWPYQWPGKDKWLESVEDVLKRHAASDLENIHSYVIWNEPNETWQDENGDFFETVWEPTYRLIRCYVPDTKIVGPATSFYGRDMFKKFLTLCRDHDCLPDLVCWHQWGSGGFIRAVEDYRSLLKELEIQEIPLCINEYSCSSDYEKRKYEGCPGYSVPFIAKFERNNVESATISWWFPGLPGRMGSLLTESNERGGGWWLYKWYGDMSGYMAMVTPPNDKSDGLDGFASVDKNNNQASIILGGNYVGDVNVVFPKLPVFLQGTVNVRLERVTWEDKDIPVKSTDLISEKEMEIKGDSFTIAVKVESELYAYRITMTAVDVPQTPYQNVIASIPGVIEAENYDVAGQGFSYYDRDAENKGEEYRDDCVDIVKAGDGYAIGYTERDEWLEYTVNVDKTDDYVVSAYVSNGGELEGFQLYLDDIKITNEYTIAQTSEDWSVYKEIRVGVVRLTKGKHVLKLLIVGSYVNVDWLKFEPYSVVESLDVLNEETILSLENARFYDLRGNEIPKNALQKNSVYIVVLFDSNRSIPFVKK
ncbi:MAG: carbohydrate-binding protein [Paludibacteraceae bacterium]|nr:carbohydrate-binding protein [Paludibacteraceae bacterium]